MAREGEAGKKFTLPLFPERKRRKKEGGRREEGTLEAEIKTC